MYKFPIIKWGGGAGRMASRLNYFKCTAYCSPYISDIKVWFFKEACFDNQSLQDGLNKHVFRIKLSFVSISLKFSTGRC